MPEARGKDEEGEREETGAPEKGKKQVKECSRCSEEDMQQRRRTNRSAAGVEDVQESAEITVQNGWEKRKRGTERKDAF